MNNTNQCGRNWDILDILYFTIAVTEYPDDSNLKESGTFWLLVQWTVHYGREVLAAGSHCTHRHGTEWQRHSRTQTQAVVLPTFSVGLSTSSHLISIIPPRHAQGLNNHTQDADECLCPGDSRSCQVDNEHEPSQCGRKIKLCRKRTEEGTGILIWANNWTDKDRAEAKILQQLTLCLVNSTEKRSVDAKDIPYYKENKRFFLLSQMWVTVAW